jgi:YD repeat-containing protein
VNDPADDQIFARAGELLSSDLAAAMAIAESAVVRWAWFTADAQFSPVPFDVQRHDLPRGRALPEEPDLTSREGVRCGFDEHGRAVMSSDIGRWSVRHTVRLFEGDTCSELVFTVAPGAAVQERVELHWVALFEYAGGVVVRQATMRPPRSPITEPELILRERHLWEYSYGPDGRLEQVWGRSWGHGYDAETERRTAAGAIETFEYDDKGRLARITARGVLPGAPLHVVYKRRTKASTGGKSRTALAAQLAQSIEDAVKACACDEQVWCLALHYERESPLPPDIVLGAERERREWGNDVDLLNPAEWGANGPPRRLRLTDVDVLDACAAALDAPSGADAAVKLLNATAKRLNGAGLGDHLDVTEDFFVYAVDLELEELDANLRAALGAQRYRKLTAAGLTAP